jgi:hypothetical protein
MYIKFSQNYAVFLKNLAKVRILMGMANKLKTFSYFCKGNDQWLTVNKNNKFSSVLI